MFTIVYLVALTEEKEAISILKARSIISTNDKNEKPIKNKAYPPIIEISPNRVCFLISVILV
jgi:hypothetical protein